MGEPSLKSQRVAAFCIPLLVALIDVCAVMIWRGSAGPGTGWVVARAVCGTLVDLAALGVTGAFLYSFAMLAAPESETTTGE